MEQFNELTGFNGELENLPKNLTGQLWEIPYETTEGNPATSHLGDANFMRAWLKSRHFTIIK